MLRSIRATLDSAPTHGLFETPCVEWILAGASSGISSTSISSLFSASSRRAVRALAATRSRRCARVQRHTSGWGAARRRARHGQWCSARSWRIREFAVVSAISSRDGACAASTRAQAASHCGALVRRALPSPPDRSDRTAIDCIVDLNPQKHGTSWPGPVLHRLACRVAERGVRHVILMNPNYEAGEPGARRAAGLTVAFIV